MAIPRLSTTAKPLLSCAVLLLFLRPCAAVPNGYACQPNQVRSIGLPFCNVTLPRTTRVKDLVGRLTLQEKLSLLHAAPGTDGCAFTDLGVARLDIPTYSWTEEANTGADSSCFGVGQCATTFGSPALLAASFNRSLWRLKGEIISTEVRALNNAHGTRGCGSPPAKIGVNEWGPNINLMRDQRFGRNSELPSEDPFLTGSYAVEYVQGLQEGPDADYTKIAATLKCACVCMCRARVSVQSARGTGACACTCASAHKFLCACQALHRLLGRKQSWT